LGPLSSFFSDERGKRKENVSISGFFYAQAGRHKLIPFFKWTLVTRGIAFFFVLGFWLGGFVSWVILAFWLGDLAGLLWTWRALKTEKII
jgi:hypothetical protein